MRRDISVPHLPTGVYTDMQTTHFVEVAISRIARGFAMLAAVAVWPISAAEAPEAAERFTHIVGVNLSELPSFDALAARFGVSHVTQSGDAGSYEARICYRTLDNRAVLEFFHGEVDWGYTLRVPKSDDFRCAPSGALVGDSISVAGIKLGMEKSAYTRLVGKSDKESANYRENRFEYVRTLTDAELNAKVDRNFKNGNPQGDPEGLRHWDVGIELSASFKQGRLTSFRVDRVETN